MAIKKIQAKSIRDAMTLIKETFGSDAVILSSKDVAEGVEFIVTDEFHEQTNNDSTRAKSRATISADNLVVDLKAPSEVAIRDLKFEFESLKNLIQEQLSELVWEHKKRLHPVQALVVRKLIHLGFSAEVASRIASGLEPDLSIGEVWKIVKNKIITSLPTDVTHNSVKAGVFVMLGSSGVGKTTVIAKLAAQHSLKFGAHDIAIISTDTTKIGAGETLKIYANILNIPIRIVENTCKMRDALNNFKKKQLILIDTPGISPTDINSLQATMNMFPDEYAVEKLLVIPGNMHTQDIERTIEFYQSAGVSGCVLTKVDEAINCGGALSAAINLQLPICYVSTGQKIPDDIQVFSAIKFIGQVLNLTIKDNADESFIARSFSDVKINAV